MYGGIFIHFLFYLFILNKKRTMNLNNYFVVSDKNKKSHLLKRKVLKFIKPVSLSKSNIIIVIVVTVLCFKH